MAGPSIDFDAPDLVQHIEQLSQAELNALPFGVILIATDGRVKFYSDTEARQSGYNKSAIGLNFYELCERFGGDAFRGRIERAMEEGPVNLEIGWTGDYGDPKRDLRLRVQSARAGGVWIFVERDKG